MKRDEAGCNMSTQQQPCSSSFFTLFKKQNNFIRSAVILLAWLSCTAECIIVPSGKVGPITPYRSTPRPTPDPSRIRDPAPVVEYSLDNPEPPPLDPSYVPPSYKTLSALSGNSIFYIPLKIRNIHGFQGNSFSYVSQQSTPQQPTAPPQPDAQSKYVTWKATYNMPSHDVNPQPDVRIPVPIHEVDYSFPKKYRYQLQMKPIIVPPLPPVNQDYYHYNYNNNNNNNAKYQQQFTTTTTNNVKDKYADPLENKNADQNHYRYDSNSNSQYPKKYNQNNDGSTSKYFYYVKHDYRTDYNNKNQ